MRLCRQLSVLDLYQSVVSPGDHFAMPSSEYKVMVLYTVCVFNYRIFFYGTSYNIF